MAIILEDVQLTFQVHKLRRVRYFAIPLELSSLQVGQTYIPYINDVSIAAFCQPFGGKMGDPLIAGSDGKLFLYLYIAIPHGVKWLVVKPMSLNHLLHEIEEHEISVVYQLVVFKSIDGCTSASIYLPLLIHNRRH